MMEAIWIAESEDPLFNNYGKDLKTHQRVSLALSMLMFGERQGEGPRWEEMPIKAIGMLTEGHIKALKEQDTEGHHPGWLGPKKGYIGKTNEEVEQAALKMLLDLWESAVIGRSMNYPETMSKRLVDDGVLFSPLMVTLKKDDRARMIWCDKMKAYKLRAIHNHKDANKRSTVNSGLFSFRVPLQMGTDDQTIGATVILEEYNNPGYFIRGKKKDYSKAFTIVGEHRRMVGLRAAIMRGVANIKRVLTFGGKDAPGAWETKGSAPSDACRGMPWGNPDRYGDSIPRHNRCTDDTLHSVAVRGRRREEYIKGFDQAQDVLVGRTLNNEENEAWSEGWTDYQHSFGGLLAFTRRKLISPLSTLQAGHMVAHVVFH
jgi:hypothetical protein